MLRDVSCVGTLDGKIYKKMRDRAVSQVNYIWSLIIVPSCLYFFFAIHADGSIGGGRMAVPVL